MFDAVMKKKLMTLTFYWATMYISAFNLYQTLTVFFTLD